MASKMSKDVDLKYVDLKDVNLKDVNVAPTPQRQRTSGIQASK
jgi:hypothetical protein